MAPDDIQRIDGRVFVAGEEFEEMFIKPIVNAAYPGTLAGLDLAVIQLTEPSGCNVAYGSIPPPYHNPLGLVLALGAMAFLVSAFAIFFHTVYPSRRKYWTMGAVTFILGLGFSLLAVFLLLFSPPQTCPIG